jgi:hypothetical protein
MTTATTHEITFELEEEDVKALAKAAMFMGLSTKDAAKVIVMHGMRNPGAIYADAMKDIIKGL